MITRRQFIKSVGLAGLAAVSLGGYAVGIEPVARMTIAEYRVTPPRWPNGLKLRLVLIADLHACHPWMPPDRIVSIVETANGLGGDAILLLGDYTASHRFVTSRVSTQDWSGPLGTLTAPLGVHAILGNHDWWDDAAAQARKRGPVVSGLAIADAGIPVYENDAVRLEKDGQPFWIAGLADQFALRSPYGGHRFVGLDDLPGTLAMISDDAPVILMAHEPDIFPKVPERVALTLCGHTHGGQVRLFGYSPVVPSRYGNRFAYGHVVELRPGDVAPRHLVVSGGLGCSIMPIRFGMPPEITVVDIATAQ